MRDGRAADTALLTRQFDLVILDIGLPGLDGFEVLKRARERSGGLCAPVTQKA